MCGICGWVDASPGGHADRAVLDRMNRTLAHRGPDSTGAVECGDAALAMSRLSIIDLAGGQQPMWNEDGSCCLVYNGELYNFHDLQPDLAARGHVFRSRCDTEVVLHAYEEWGPDCLERFNGMFAFAVWDDRRQTLFLARDRVGEKPLYYYWDGDRLIFASEIKAILQHPAVHRETNLRGLANFLAFGHAVAPDTIYRNIYKLLPGHYLSLREGDLRLVQYWDVADAPERVPESASASECATQVLALLDDAVRRRLVADVPLGAFLSGGVDSSAIVALMQRHTAAPVKTYSLGFTVGGAFNELEEARQTASALGTDHHELCVDHVDLVSLLRRLVYQYDEPFADAAALPVLLLSQFARREVKVVLTGDGGDELFGGYRRYAVDQFAALYQRLAPGPTAPYLAELAGALPRLRRTKRALQTLPVADPARRYASWLTLFTADMRRELLAPEVLAQIDEYDPSWPYPRYYAALNGHSAADHVNRLMYTDLKTWLADAYLEKTDKATMACSLEARLPLLDHRLVELAFQIPGRYKIRGLSTKRIFKQAIRSLVPPAVLARRKHGFSVPTDPWLRGELRVWSAEILLDDRARHRGYFDMRVVERMLREHADGRHVWDAQLWLLLNLELWHRIYLDGEPV